MAVVLSPKSCKALVTDKQKMGAEAAGKKWGLSVNTVYRRIRHCSKESLKPYLRARKHNTFVDDLDPAEVRKIYHELRSIKATAVHFQTSVETINKIIPPRARLHSASKSSAQKSRKTPSALRKTTCQVEPPKIVRIKRYRPVKFPEGCSNCGTTVSSSFRSSPVGDGTKVCNACRHSLQKQAQNSPCVRRCRRACARGP